MENMIADKIKKIIDDNEVVLFMKGKAESPQCGFSGVVVKILNQLGVNFLDVNVMENNEIREGIKIFSDWPTIPQLYIRQQFVGGCDIVRDMYKSGELVDLLVRHDIKLGS